MKTLTEFYGKTLKTLEEQIPALTKELTASITETMKAEGKSEEEVAAGLPVVLKTQLDAKIGEIQKAEGDKLALLMGALSAIKGKRGNLKRVIVMTTSTEGEKAPSGAFELDGKFFICEFFPEPTRAHKNGRDGGDRREGRGGRDGKRGGKRGRGGREGGRDDRGGRGGDRPRGPRGPRIDGAPGMEASSGSNGAPSGEAGEKRSRRPRRNPRPPRAPRPDEPVRAPGEKWKIIPRSEMPAAAAQPAQATSESSSTNSEPSSN